MDSFVEALRRNTHSSQDYITAPGFDSHGDIDAPSKIDDTSSFRHDSKLQHDIDSTASTEVISLPIETIEPNQDGTFSRVRETTYDLTKSQTSQTRTDIKQVPNTQLLQ